MKLSLLLKEFSLTSSSHSDPEITGITHDSRNVEPGFIFAALPGHHVEGSTFIKDAISKGASAVLAETKIDASVPVIVSHNIRSDMALLARAIYKKPDTKLFMAGITGTNGKTTITYFLETLMKEYNRNPGVIGTINYRYAGKVLDAPNTTPESPQIYSMLSEMVKSGCKAAIMEVSSHALELHRVEGIEFDTAVFTNLTSDHLDLHKTTEAYFDAKSKLFSSLGPGEKNNTKFAVINADDPWADKLISRIDKRVEVITYGIDKNADIKASYLKLTGKESIFSIKTGTEKKQHVCINHIGRHNVYNALAAIAVMLAHGMKLEDIISCMEKIPVVPGRLEKIDLGQNYTVVVDFAHTDDALKNVLSTLKSLKPNRIITVFGCGGDRDRTKRPIMGETAAKLSDFVFVTSDNPRSEDPEKIALDIEIGIRRNSKNNYQVIIEREQAIAAAVKMAQKNDIILIAGKGHENYQLIQNKKYHFNDSETAKKYIALSRQLSAVS